MTKKKTPLISIVIPTLNEEEYLPGLLQDLQNQTKKNFEVIVVDGKSVDQTKKRAMVFAKDIDLTFLEATKRNTSYQKNFGAKHARGVFLFFLDADNRIGKDCMEKLQGYIDREKKLLYLPLPKPSNENLFNMILFAISIKAVIGLQKVGKALSFGPAILIQRELFERIGRFDEAAYVSEDHNLIVKAYKAKVKVRFMKDVNFIFSMRRFESEGALKVTTQYVIFTWLTFFKGVVYKSSIPYKMGGQEYKKNA